MYYTYYLYNTYNTYMYYWGRKKIMTHSQKEDCIHGVRMVTKQSRDIIIQISYQG